MWQHDSMARRVDFAKGQVDLVLDGIYCLVKVLIRLNLKPSYCNFVLQCVECFSFQTDATARKQLLTYVSASLLLVAQGQCRSLAEARTRCLRRLAELLLRVLGEELCEGDEGDGEGGDGGSDGKVGTTVCSRMKRVKSR